MAWFLRAIELPDGQWLCRQGRIEYDLHDDLEEAVAHLRELARHLGPSELFVHAREGAVVRLGPAKKHARGVQPDQDDAIRRT